MSYTGLTIEYLDRYNIETNTAYKRRFGKTFTADKYLNLIKKLGFCVNSYEKNYKFAIKTISLFGMGYKGWHTTNKDKKFTRISKIKAFRLGLDYNKQIPTYDDILLKQHCCANRILNRIARTTDKNAYINNAYVDNSYKCYHNTLISIYNMNHTLGACYSDNNNVIHFDIDDHNNEGIADTKLKMLLKLLGVQLTDALMMEKSVYNGGIHISFKLPYHIRDRKFYKELEKRINQHISGIDIDFSRTVLRLPLSYEYNPVNLTTGEFYKTFNNFYKSVNFDKTIHSEIIDTINRAWTSDIDEITNELLWKLKHKKPVDFDELTPLLKIKIKLEEDKKHSSYFKQQQVVIIPKTKDMKTCIDDFDFSITAGNRHKMFQRLVPKCVNEFNMTLDQTVNYLYDHNGGSKDINQYGKEGIKNSIKNFYNECVKNKDIYAKDQHFFATRFISNKKFIPEDLLTILENKNLSYHINEWFIKEYISVRNQYEKDCYHISDEKKRNIHLQFPFILQEVIGSFFYQMNNISDKRDRCIVDYFNQYIGFQFPEIHLRRIVNESKDIIGVSSDKKFNSFQLQYLKKAIFNLLKLNPFTLKMNNGVICQRNYRNGFCTSYIPTIQNIFNFFVQLSKKFKFIKNSQKLFSSLFSYIISYIELEGNLLKKQDYLKMVKKVAIENGIDPPRLCMLT